jgi:hypothetical protein
MPTCWENDVDVATVRRPEVVIWLVVNACKEQAKETVP